MAAYGLTPPPDCPPTGTPAITLVISVTTRVLSIAVPPLPKKFGDHEKSSSNPNTPALIQPTAAPTFSLLLLLTAPRRVLPALPPKSTPTVGLTKPSARPTPATRTCRRRRQRRHVSSDTPPAFG